MMGYDAIGYRKKKITGLCRQAIPVVFLFGFNKLALLSGNNGYLLSLTEGLMMED